MRLSLLFGLLCVATLLTAQVEKQKFGKVPQVDLDMTVYEADPDAAAVVLHERTEYEISLQSGGYFMRTHRRVKILDESAFDEGDFEIQYTKRKGYQLQKLKAVITQPDGSQTEVSKRDMFEKEVRDDWYEKSFAFPNVQVGSVLEVEVKMFIDGAIEEILPYTYQEEMPMRYGEVVFENADMLVYMAMIQAAEVRDQGDGLYMLTANPSMFKETQFVRIGQAEKKTFILKNAPGLKAENHIGTITDFAANIKMSLEYYPDRNGLLKPRIKGWDQVAKIAEKYEYIGGQIKGGRHNRDFLEAIMPIVKSAGTDNKARIEAAYNYIVENITWNEKFSLAADENLDKVFEERSGNSAARNLMLLAVAEELGILYKPVLVSTRSNGVLITTYPTIQQFNHLVAAIKIDGDYQIIDVPQSSYYPMNVLRYEALNDEGLIVGENGVFQWVPITPSQSYRVVQASMSLDEEHNMVGQYKGVYKTYPAVGRRSVLTEKGKDEYKSEYLAEDLPDLELQNFESKNLNNKAKPLQISFDLKSATPVQEGGDMLYVQPMLTENYTDNPFSTKDRNAPVRLPYPIKQQYIFTLDIPEGYAVESIPESAIFNLENGMGMFKFIAEEKNGQVKLMSVVDVRSTYFSVESFEFLQKFFEGIVEKHAEQIVLKKA